MKIKFLSVLKVASAAFFIACAPAVAQWQTPNHSVPIGRGAGTGFKSAAPGTAGQVLTSNGASADPSFKDSVPAVAIENFGGGCGVSDNTQALIDAVASTGTAPVRVLFNGNCNYQFTQPDALLFSKGGVFLQGAGKYVTYLNFNPTGDGTFLKWKGPIGPLPLYYGGITNLSIYSSDITAYTKVAVEIVDVSSPLLEHFTCGTYRTDNSSFVGGTGSTCLYTRGRDIATFNDLHLAANIAWRIGPSPYSAASIAMDHWHIRDVEIQTVGSYPNIVVDPGSVFGSSHFAGYQAWVNGTHGFYWNDTATYNKVGSVVTPGSGYAVGDIYTVAGGTCSTPVTLLITGVSAGGVTSAAVDNPGVCSVAPSSPTTQASTTGGGSGASLNVGLQFSDNLVFSGVRTEQGGGGYTFYIAPPVGTVIYGLQINNNVLDGGRDGIFLRGSKSPTISGNTSLFANVLEALNATSANANDMVQLSQNIWGTGMTKTTTGMTDVSHVQSPTATSTTVPPTALYSSSITGQTLNNLTLTGTLALPPNVTGQAFWAGAQTYSTTGIMTIAGGGRSNTQPFGGWYANPNDVGAQFTAETAGGVEGGFFAFDTDPSVVFGSWSNHDVKIRTNNTARIKISASTGAIQLIAYGAGILTSDASGNITASSVPANFGGTGVANNAASTLTITGAFATTLTISGITNLTLPTSGTVATLAGTETFTNKTLTSPAINGGAINNATVGATTPSTGAFTTLTASGLFTSNGQIKFPSTQNPSTDVNTLDDYREVAPSTTCTPNITFGGAAVGVTYGAGNDCSVVKIGKLVFVNGTLSLSSKGSSTGVAQIGGWPIASNGIVAPGNIGFFNSMTGLTGSLLLELSLGTTDRLSVIQSGATGTTNVTDAAFTNTSRIDFSLTYIANQ